MATLTIEAISDDLTFGARVGGITRDSLDDPQVRTELVDAFEARGLLIFEKVEAAPSMQVAISNVFGPLKDHPSKATPRADGDDLLGVIEIRHEPDDPGAVRVDGTMLTQWLPWHFDHCYNDKLNRAGVLRAVECSGEGGLTGFVDGIALYEAFDVDLRSEIESETIIYAMDVIMANLRFGRPSDFEEIEPSGAALAVMEEFANRPRALHPAVWTRTNGEKVLHVSPWMAKGIAGHEDDSGDELLSAVCDEIVARSSRLSYFHRWRPTDMVIWDNWRCLHSVSGMPRGERRCMHRTTIDGDYGHGRFEA